MSKRMRLSEELMNEIYSEDTVELNNKAYQESKSTYLRFQNELRRVINDDGFKVALVFLSRSIFKERNKISIKRSSYLYQSDQSSILPKIKDRFFPILQAFCIDVDIMCAPDFFDNAVTAKIDVYTQALSQISNETYCEIKKYFSNLENCINPLDILFHGLFHESAKRKTRNVYFKIIALVLIISIAIILL